MQQKGKADFCTFAESSTLHGFRYTFPVSKSSIWRRLAWAVFLLAAAAGFAYTLADTVVRYYKYESYLVTTVEGQTTIELPSITICPTNPYKQELAKNYPAVLDLLLNGTLENPALSNITTSEVNENTKFAFSELIADVAYIENWQDRILQVYTDKGMCYTFNPHDSDRLIITGTGESSALQFILDPQLERGQPGFSSDEGLHIAVHDSAEFPLMDQNSLSLSPGTKNRIALTKYVSQSLGRPYSSVDCVPNPEDPDKQIELTSYFNLPYSYESCLFSCMGSLFFEDCGFYSYQNGTRPCTFADYWPAMIRGWERVKEAGGYNAACKECLPTCTKVNFRKETSFNKFPNNHALKNLRVLRPNYTMEELESMISVEVYFSSLNVVTERQVPALSSVQLFSEFGGILGLFLGASFLTLLEFVDYLLVLLHEKLSMSRKK